MIQMQLLKRKHNDVQVDDDTLRNQDNQEFKKESFQDIQKRVYISFLSYIFRIFKAKRNVSTISATPEESKILEEAQSNISNVDEEKRGAFKINPGFKLFAEKPPTAVAEPINFKFNFIVNKEAGKKEESK